MNTTSKFAAVLAAAAFSTAAIAQQAPATSPAAAAAPAGEAPAAPAPAADAQQAYTAPESATVPASPDASAQAAISDAEVQQFASAAMALEAIDQDTTIPDADKQPAMAAKVQENGLTPQRFNEIGQATQADPALMQRVQAAMVALQTPAA